MQIWIYISWYLAAGAAVTVIGLTITRYLGYRCGRLQARLEHQQGIDNHEKVDQELAKIQEDFNHTAKWMIWYVKMVIFWPRSLWLYMRQSSKTLDECEKILKALNDTES